MYRQLDDFKLPNLPLNQTFLRGLNEKYRQPLRSCLHEILKHISVKCENSWRYHLCFTSITVHMTRSYLNLEAVWFQSCLQHRFENSLWFENLELMTILLFNQSDCGSENCTFRFRCKAVMNILCKQNIFATGLRFQTGLISVWVLCKQPLTLLYILCCCRFVCTLNVHTILLLLDQSIYDGLNKDIKEEHIHIIDGKRCSSVIFCCMAVR